MRREKVKLVVRFSVKQQCYVLMGMFSFPLIDFYSLPEPSSAAATQANREEVDSRSVFVGNVRPLTLISI